MLRKNLFSLLLFSFSLYTMDEQSNSKIKTLKEIIQRQLIPVLAKNENVQQLIEQSKFLPGDLKEDLGDYLCAKYHLPLFNQSDAFLTECSQILDVKVSQKGNYLAIVGLECVGFAPLKYRSCFIVYSIGDEGRLEEVAKLQGSNFSEQELDRKCCFDFHPDEAFILKTSFDKYEYEKIQCSSLEVLGDPVIEKHYILDLAFNELGNMYAIALLNGLVKVRKTETDEVVFQKRIDDYPNNIQCSFGNGISQNLLALVVDNAEKDLVQVWDLAKKEDVVRKIEGGVTGVCFYGSRCYVSTKTQLRQYEFFEDGFSSVYEKNFDGVLGLIRAMSDDGKNFLVSQYDSLLIIDKRGSQFNKQIVSCASSFYPQASLSLDGNTIFIQSFCGRLQRYTKIIRTISQQIEESLKQYKIDNSN